MAAGSSVDRWGLVAEGTVPCRGTPDHRDGVRVALPLRAKSTHSTRNRRFPCKAAIFAGARSRPIAGRRNWPTRIALRRSPEQPRGPQGHSEEVSSGKADFGPASSTTWNPKRNPPRSPLAIECRAQNLCVCSGFRGAVPGLSRRSSKSVEKLEPQTEPFLPERRLRPSGSCDFSPKAEGRPKGKPRGAFLE
jgi:hypothetical protein